MPTLRVERTYTVGYLDGRTSPTMAQLFDARRTILLRALLADDHEPNSIDYDILPERLVVSIRSAESVVGQEQVTATLYHAVVRDLDDRLASFGRAISRAATDLSASQPAAAPLTRCTSTPVCTSPGRPLTVISSSVARPPVSI